MRRAVSVVRGSAVSPATRPPWVRHLSGKAVRGAGARSQLGLVWLVLKKQPSERETLARLLSPLEKKNVTMSLETGNVTFLPVSKNKESQSNCSFDIFIEFPSLERFLYRHSVVWTPN